MFSSSNLQTGNLGHPFRKGNEGFRISFPHILTGMALLVTIVLLVFASVSPATGQDSGDLEPGRAIIDNIDSEHLSRTYFFDGQEGDLVLISVYGLTPDMDPNLTLVGPDPQTLQFDKDESFPFFTSTERVTYRLQNSGMYTVQVSGTEGSFLLLMRLLPSTPTAQLEVDSPVTVSLPAAENGQAYLFDTDPAQSSSILFDVEPIDADVQIDVRSSTGASVAVLRRNLHNVCLAFEPTDQRYEVTVLSSRETAGTVTITLSNATCGFAEPMVTNTTSSQTNFIPIEVEGVCVASNHSNVNIRTGDSTDYDVVAQLPAQQPINVIGQNTDGTWYAVENEGLAGWISAAVVFVTGPCDNLPIVPVTDEQPEAMPTVTEEPMAEETPEATPEPETTPEATPESTPEATESP